MQDAVARTGPRPTRTKILTSEYVQTPTSTADLDLVDTEVRCDDSSRDSNEVAQVRTTTSSLTHAGPASALLRVAAVVSLNPRVIGSSPTRRTRSEPVPGSLSGTGFLLIGHRFVTRGVAGHTLLSREA